MIFRPATPGFLACLGATVLLALVTFSVPYLRSIFFLRATVDQVGTFTFGALGYCLESSGTTTCTSPAVGYEFNPNALLGNNLPIQIPSVLVRWLTYALVLHPVALVLAAISAVFGLLAHVREMSMSCFSSCISGFAAAAALFAFIFDIVLFLLTRTRVNAIPNSNSEIGMAVWLTLIAWVLLFFAGCLYGCGRCCLARRPRAPKGEKYKQQPYTPTVPAGTAVGGSAVNTAYAEQVRLEAIKAEADRKATQKETGLPAFPEYESAKVPLQHGYDSDEDVQNKPYRDNQFGRQASGHSHGSSEGAPPRRQATGDITSSPGNAGMAGRGAGYAGGYARAPAGTRTVDDYYANGTPSSQGTAPTPTSYPPQPSRTQTPGRYQQPSTNSQYPYDNRGGYDNHNDQYGPTGTHGQYLSAGYGAGAGAGRGGYGHEQRGTSYHSAVSHQTYATAYDDGVDSSYPAYNTNPTPGGQTASYYTASAGPTPGSGSGQGYDTNPASSSYFPYDTNYNPIPSNNITNTPANPARVISPPFPSPYNTNNPSTSTPPARTRSPTTPVSAGWAGRGGPSVIHEQEESGPPPSMPNPYGVQGSTTGHSLAPPPSEAPPSYTSYDGHGNAFAGATSTGWPREKR